MKTWIRCFCFLYVIGALHAFAADHLLIGFLLLAYAGAFFLATLARTLTFMLGIGIGGIALLCSALAAAFMHPKLPLLAGILWYGITLAGIIGVVGAVYVICAGSKGCKNLP